MAILQQNIPTALRSGSAAAPTVRGSVVPERRPYLVTSAKKTAQTVQRCLELFPHESEDARLTGATRSLHRRLLALNLRQEKISVEMTTLSTATLHTGAKIA